MAVVTRTTTWSDGQVLTASALNGEFNNLLNAPAIVNADIASNAAIAISKIATGISGSIVGTSDTQTLTNKRITRRLTAVTQSATPSINSDNMDIAKITGLAQAITSFTTNLTGTPNDGDLLEIRITDNGTARALTFGASFQSTTITLPTTTVISTEIKILFEWNSVASKWDCVATA